MRFYDERLETSLGRGAGGLVIGSAVGSMVTLIGFLGMALAEADDPFRTLARAISGLFLFIPIFIVWMIGAFTLGAGGWAILDALRLRGVLSAIAWGGAITFLVATGMTGGQAMPFSLLIGVAGIVAGLATWKVSYRRPAPRVNEVFA
jgi:hypothetical protein